MNIAGFFIRRPVTTTLLMAALLVFGAMAYFRLPVSDLPNVDFPTINVSASLPGASPETMASSVATPLEKEFSTIAGLDSMSSSSTLGSTSITLQFSLDRSIDAAAQDVQSAISRASNQLPPDMPAPPTYRKVNPADSPILYMALTSPTLPLSTVDEYGETTMAQRISTVSGVAQVMVFGAQKYAVRVQLDPNALASRGIGIDEVRQAIQNANVNLPTGTLYGEHKAFTLEPTGQLENAEAYRPVIVAYRNGFPVRLGELGRVIDSVQNDKVASWFNGTRGIILAVQRQPGTNTVEVVDRIRNLLPTLRAQIPASVSLDIVYDRSESIRESVNDVKFTLMLTIALVVLVIFLFLRNVSATIIPSLALPLSIVGTFAVMYQLGFSLDNLSLMALTLSVGFVVDDAIVMLENIVRHLEMGKPPLEAAFAGAREIGFTIVSMTISLAAVFIPVLFMGGIVGRLFHEFGVTIAVAILVSGFVSLSLTPMLCSRFLRPPSNTHGIFYRALERVFDGMLRIYDWTLRRVLRARLAVMLLSIVLLLVTGYLFVIIPKGFIPAQDTNQIFGVTEGPQDVSYDAMVAYQQAVDAVIARDPNVVSLVSTINRGTLNTGFVFARLKPRSERTLSAEEIIEQLRPQLAAVPGIRVYLQVPPLIQIGGQLTKSLYQYTLQSSDMEELHQWAPRIASELRKLPGFQDVTTDLQIQSPQVVVAIDRDKASSLGVTAAQIENALADAYGSRQVSTIYTPTNEYWVIMELEPRYQRDPNALSLLYVRSASGRLVPLNAVARLTPGVGPLTVNHFGQTPAVTVSFNLQPGVSLGGAVTALEDVVQRINLPATITTSFQGTAQAFQSSLGGMGLLLLMAVAVIYMVLGILYESFVHPITILSGLPSAGLGALLTLMVFGDELNVYSLVGIIMLIGIVKKNAIMMIDFALDAQRGEGKSAAAAIYEACLIRFRPIMMTTMAALMGTLPIALAFGAGGEARRPLGLAVVGGLLVSQLLTLYLTPVYFIYLDRFSTLFRRRKAPRAHPTPTPAPESVT
ncbi:MAG TPA: multidrug efflux RND transporter permease subunit [Bryobacteraceae bacterium]|nr:multidrug efflux RND transporter permease subunit [Bryobacteraceae bacterium]HPQ14773.1 multidrug efflux RND transporter permease subunit [Bryobacteraceae bacterium]HPU71346.1 multidrug efflux RND transporter permease subunit [Bryobacteraceae bacterium]